MAIIETKKLTKFYGKSRGIIDVDLSIEKGEVFGFIGPNGAGKSTTIRTLLGLIYPTSGSATIFGKDIILQNTEIKEDIGYLPSEVFYYDDMRVIDLLSYSGSFYKKNQVTIKRRINELAEIMDLNLTKKIDDLSYGNKKKVGIIQGLLHEPKLIILDEPTGGLDPLMQQKFFTLLKEENDKGTTILFSSHVLSEVQHLCDRVAIIKEGRIIKTEKISDLIKNNHKRFTLEVTGKISPVNFAIPGIQGLNIIGHKITFMYHGPVSNILKLISSLQLRNILIEDPDLEEIFLHYYSKEG